MSWLDTAITYRHVLYTIVGAGGGVVLVALLLLGLAAIEGRRLVREARRHYDGDEA